MNHNETGCEGVDWIQVALAGYSQPQYTLINRRDSQFFASEQLSVPLEEICSKELVTAYFSYLNHVLHSQRMVFIDL